MHYKQCTFVTNQFTSLYYTLKFRSDFSTFRLAVSSFFLFTFFPIIVVLEPLQEKKATLYEMASKSVLKWPRKGVQTNRWTKKIVRSYISRYYLDVRFSSKLVKIYFNADFMVSTPFMNGYTQAS